MLKTAIEQLLAGADLTAEQAGGAMRAIADGEADSVQTSAFMVLLRAKGETAEEVSAIVRALLDRTVPVDLPAGPAYLDIVGTGGDGKNYLNISTSAAVLAAACGASVAKHGNRSVSSKSGSSDVLEVLGVPMLSPEHIAPCLAQAGVAFMFAPHFHPAFAHVVPVRRALQVRTVFNILGPLLNPARATRAVIGVYTPELVPLMADTLRALGVQHALVVHCCGADELVPMGVARVARVTPEGVTDFDFDPREFVPECTDADLLGGDAEFNARRIREIFAGGAAADCAAGNTIALNAGAGLFVAGLAGSVQEGYEQARAALAEGRALAKLEEWVGVCGGLSTA